MTPQDKPLFEAFDLVGKFNFMGPTAQAEYLNAKFSAWVKEHYEPLLAQRDKLYFTLQQHEVDLANGPIGEKNKRIATLETALNDLVNAYCELVRGVHVGSPDNDDVIIQARAALGKEGE